jgi:hypothetical protein
MTTLKALEIWTAQSICDTGILLSVVSSLLYGARPYFARTRDALPLKIAADMWWMWYVVARDGALFAAFMAGLWTLNLDLMADIKIALPFVPVGTVLLAVALALKVQGSGRERTIAVVIGLAAVVNLLGYVLVMEGPGVEYAVAAHPIWRALLSCRSNANPYLAVVTFSITFPALVLVAAFAAVAGRSAVAPKSDLTDRLQAGPVPQTGSRN